MKVLKFGAIWCKECLVMKPLWEEIEGEMPELKTEYFDADENSELLKKYSIEDIPVFIFLDKEDNEILRLEGAISKEKIMEAVKENIDK